MAQTDLGGFIVSIANEQRYQSIVHSLKATAQARELANSPVGATLGIRYVTISRQAGTGGKSLAKELAQAINCLQLHEDAWYAWDRELVDKVAAEHHIEPEFVEALEDSGHHWFSEFIASLSSQEQPGEFKVYRRVAMTVRALAIAGRAIIVGRGGVFITAGLPGGLHVRLVAPFESRVHRMADRLHISPEQAAVKVRETDHNRMAFYRRYWPDKNVGTESFALTFNTAELTDQQMVDSILALIFGASRPQSNRNVPRPAVEKIGTEYGGAR